MFPKTVLPSLLLMHFLAFPMLASAPSSELPSTSFKLPHVWLYADSDPPAMRLTLSKNGECRFKGGFLFWNPGRWRFEPKSSRLTLTFKKLSASEIKSMLQNAKRDGIISADISKRSITYRIDPISPEFTFEGRVFFPDPSANEQ